MIASVAIGLDRDLTHVAEGAGNANPDDRWYEDGILYVRGVSQGALDLAALNSRPAVHRRISALSFLERFTQAERIMIRAASRESALLEDWLDMLRAAQEVDLDDPRTIAGLNSMVAAGLLSAARRDEIMP